MAREHIQILNKLLKGVISYWKNWPCTSVKVIFFGVPNRNFQMAVNVFVDIWFYCHLNIKHAKAWHFFADSVDSACTPKSDKIWWGPIKKKKILKYELYYFKAYMFYSNTISKNVLFLYIFNMHLFFCVLIQSIMLYL